jgi:PAS domain S-box-containing protein
MHGTEVGGITAPGRTVDLELIPAAVIVRRFDGTILWWNSGARNLYGWTSEAVRGRSTHRLLGTVFESGSADEQRAALAGDGRWDGQLRHRTAAGHTVTVLSRQVVHRTGDDGDAEVLEINTDVTEARAAEQVRDHAAAALAERNTALEVADRLRLDIIGKLGHELSNPLSAILGYSDLLADDMEAGSPAATAVTVISRQAQRLDEIVREVMSLVGVAAGDLSAGSGEVRHGPRPAGGPGVTREAEAV